MMAIFLYSSTLPISVHTNRWCFLIKSHQASVELVNEYCWSRSLTILKRDVRLDFASVRHAFEIKAHCSSCLWLLVVKVIMLCWLTRWHIEGVVLLVRSTWKWIWQVITFELAIVVCRLIFVCNYTSRNELEGGGILGPFVCRHTFVRTISMKLRTRDQYIG